MNMMPNRDVEDFVKSRFGPKTAETLGHISQGGGNNEKGADFEGGMEVKVAVNVAAPETSQLAHLGSRAEAFMLLMALEAGMLADRQPKGNQQ
jgi:hypothetical protein